MNPLEVAVSGATLEAAVVSGIKYPSTSLNLSWTQKTPKSIDIRVEGNNFVSIIPKNTKFSPRKVFLFTTVHVYQIEALIFVYEDDEKAVEKTIS